jgi:hypothetical protein
MWGDTEGVFAEEDFCLSGDLRTVQFVCSAKGQDLRATLIFS